MSANSSLSENKCNAKGIDFTSQWRVETRNWSEAHKANSHKAQERFSSNCALVAHFARHSRLLLEYAVTGLAFCLTAKVRDLCELLENFHWHVSTTSCFLLYPREPWRRQKFIAASLYYVYSLGTVITSRESSLDTITYTMRCAAQMSRSRTQASVF